MVAASAVWCGAVRQYRNKSFYCQGVDEVMAQTCTGAGNRQELVPLPLSVRCGAVRRCRNTSFRSQWLGDIMTQARAGARTRQELVPLMLPLPARCGAVRCGAVPK